MRPPPPALAALQRWLQRIVTHDGAIAEAIAAAGADPELASFTVAETIVAGASTAADRLAIYADQHRWRMAEAFAGRYPSVAIVVGEGELGLLAAAYFAASGEAIGDDFPGFVATREELRDRDLVAALARLDQAVSEVGAQPAARRLRPEQLAAIPVTAWPETRLRLIPALRLLQLDYPVHDYLIGIGAGEDEPAARRRSWLVVWRRASSGEILRAPLNHPQFLLLERLRAGDSLGEAITAAAAVVTLPFDLSRALTAWFKRWTEEGLLAAVTPADES